MRNFDIHTTLGVVPSMASKKKKAFYFITRGSSATLTFNLMNRAYTFDQIEQLTFLLGNPNGKILKYNAFNESGELNPNCKHWEDLEGHEYNYVSMILSPEQTALLEVTNSYNLVKFEIAVTIDGDDEDPDGQPYTQIEEQPLVGVIDSIYSHTIGD